LIREKGIFVGLFSEDELVSDNVKGKKKIMQKLDYTFQVAVFVSALKIYCIVIEEFVFFRYILKIKRRQYQHKNKTISLLKYQGHNKLHWDCASYRKVNKNV
jgi:hypothetical protein